MGKDVVAKLKATINLKTVIVASLDSKVEQLLSNVSTNELELKVALETKFIVLHSIANFS